MNPIACAPCHAVSAHGSIIAAAEKLNVTTRGLATAGQARDRNRADAARAPRARRAADRRRHRSGVAQHRVLSLLEEAEAELESATAPGPAARITVAPSRPPRAASRRRRSRPRCAKSIRSSPSPFTSRNPASRSEAGAPRRRPIVINDWRKRAAGVPEGLTKAPLFDDIADIALPPGHRFAGMPGRKLINCRAKSGSRAGRIDCGHDFCSIRCASRARSRDYAHGRRICDAVGAGSGGPRRLHSAAARAVRFPGVSVVPTDPALTSHVYARAESDDEKGCVRAARRRNCQFAS